MCAVLSVFVLVAAAFASGSIFAGGSRDRLCIPGASTEPADPMDSFREERRIARQMQVSQLNALISSPYTDDELGRIAVKRLYDLLEWTEQETTLEGILQMRDFEDAIATVHDGSVNILVRTEGLSQRQAMVILKIVTEETGISGGNVKIIPIK